MIPDHRRFRFDGGAGTYVGTAILAFLVTVFTLGICYPFGLVLMERWRAKHSYIDGQQLVFTGTAWGLFGKWIKWLFLMVITLGIYSFWVVPRIQQWKWEHTAFVDPSVNPYFSAAHISPAGVGSVAGVQPPVTVVDR
ncbi:MAG: DUF898 family protein [Gordonia sp. (in: high G+C Gram-positive bacteria)]|uniref:DUF898 family protein n=1 Tax=Gordonia sp. (in: high G+C Gram-positive bacteria) TaxID=84139 RepID=UPI003BB5D8EC